MMPTFERIDYINSLGAIREHLLEPDTMRTLCGLEIEGAQGSLRGYQSPCGNPRCRNCDRQAAHLARKGAAAQ